VDIDEEGGSGWRYLLVWTAVPSLLSAILGYFYLLETPRYALN